MFLSVRENVLNTSQISNICTIGPTDRMKTCPGHHVRMWHRLVAPREFWAGPSKLPEQKNFILYAPGMWRCARREPNVRENVHLCGVLSTWGVQPKPKWPGCTPRNTQNLAQNKNRGLL